MIQWGRSSVHGDETFAVLRWQNNFSYYQNRLLKEISKIWKIILSVEYLNFSKRKYVFNVSDLLLLTPPTDEGLIEEKRESVWKKNHALSVFCKTTKWNILVKDVSDN